MKGTCGKPKYLWRKYWRNLISIATGLDDNWRAKLSPVLRVRDLVQSVEGFNLSYNYIVRALAPREFTSYHQEG